MPDTPSAMKTPLPKPLDLARKYIALLRAEVGDELLARVAKLNRAEANPMIDHLGDVVDTNEFMIEAWESVTGEELDFDPNNEPLMEVLNAAFNLAKGAGFHPGVLLPLSLYNAGHRINKQGRLLDPAKRLVPEEIAKEHGTSIGVASQAVHMVHVWSLGTVPVGIPDKI